MMSVQMESCTIEKNGFNAFYYPGECEQARKDSFKRILTFIEEWRK